MFIIEFVLITYKRLNKNILISSNFGSPFTENGSPKTCATITLGSPCQVNCQLNRRAHYVLLVEEGCDVVMLSITRCDGSTKPQGNLFSSNEPAQTNTIYRPLWQLHNITSGSLGPQQRVANNSIMFQSGPL